MAGSGRGATGRGGGGAAGARRGGAGAGAAPPPVTATRDTRESYQTPTTRKARPEPVEMDLHHDPAVRELLADLDHGPGIAGCCRRRHGRRHDSPGPRRRRAPARPRARRRTGSIAWPASPLERRFVRAGVRDRQAGFERRLRPFRAAAPRRKRRRAGYPRSPRSGSGGRRWRPARPTSGNRGGVPQRGSACASSGSRWAATAAPTRQRPPANWAQAPFAAARGEAEHFGRVGRRRRRQHLRLDRAHAG